MESILGGLLLIAALVAIIAFMLSGARTGTRGNFKDPINALGTPSGDTPIFVLATLAVGQLLAWPAGGRGLTSTAGATFGVLCALVISWPTAKTVLGVVGVIAALVSAIEFCGAGVGTYGSESVVFRVAFMGLVTMCYALGSMVGVMFLGRSVRTFAFGYGRGLAFFGLIDLAQFFASPLGEDLLGLDRDALLLQTAIGCAGAAVLGVAAGQFTLFVTGVAVTAINVLVPITGMIPVVPGSAAATTMSGYFVGACATYGIVRIAKNLVRRK